MKTTKVFSLLLILGVILISCQKEEITSLSNKSKKHSGLRNAADCNCVTNYSQSLVTYTSSSPSNPSQKDVIVEVWNDATTIYYKLYRVGNQQIGNLFVDGGAAIGGAVNNAYTFTKPGIGSCEAQTTSFRVTGANGPPILFSIVYKMVTLCPTQCTYTFDTGFGGSNSGAGNAWWYYYTAGSGSQPIYAGQTKLAGSVSVDASGNFTITLASGWSLDPATSESVKVQGYASVPGSRPSAGSFESKGTSLTGSVSPNNFYVVHLDLRECHQ